MPEPRTAANLKDWQERFFAQPVVWEVVPSGDESGNIYASQEAAQIEIDWRNRGKGRGRAQLRKRHIHSLELAQERWHG